MGEKVLVTGGAGFIGSHLVDALLEAGHEVSVFDSLVPQVHGGLRERNEWPDYLVTECRTILGDVRDRDALRKAIEDVDVIFHEAAVVGTGQSMYEIKRYADANICGTAVLLDTLANEKHRIRKLIVASSMSVYGEGKYHCEEHGEVYPRLRAEEQLASGDWEIRCPLCAQLVEPLSTTEEKPLYPISVYAITKQVQEEMCLAVGRAYDIPTVVLRYFNVYGPRQALSNPYTGVIAIFSSRLLTGRPPLIFEDGLQSRDFVCVSDIVQANLLAMVQKEMDYGIFNVGTGRALTILDVAEALIQHLDGEVKKPKITHCFRVGDIRHCFANIARIQAFGYRSQMQFEDGMSELVDWLQGQHAVDRSKQAQWELESRKLVYSVSKNSGYVDTPLYTHRGG